MQQQSQFPRWDYRVVSCSNQNNQWLVTHDNGQQIQQQSLYVFMRDAGNQGWELVSTHVDPAIARPSEIIRLFFKRRKS